MDKGQILEAARKNKSMGNEYEKQMSARGDLYGLVIAFLLYLAFSILEILCKGTFNVGMAAVITSSASTQSLFEGIKTKKAWLIFVGSILGITTLVFIVCHICGMVME